MLVFWKNLVFLLAQEVGKREFLMRRWYPADGNGANERRSRKASIRINGGRVPSGYILPLKLYIFQIRRRCRERPRR